MSRWIPMLLCAAAMLPAAGDEVSNRTVVPVERATEAAVARAANEFAFDLYKQVSAREGNVVICPFGVYVVLGMSYAGARRATAAQMAEVLHLNERPEVQHRDIGALAAQVRDAELPDGQAALADALWAQQGLPLLQDFLELVESDYGAKVQWADFASAAEDARRAVNAWGAEQTHGKVPEAIPPGGVERSDLLLLCSAVYFKSAWQHRFLESATISAPFWLDGATSVEVPMMRQTQRFWYRGVAGAQILEVPYLGDEFSMLLVLPRDKDGMAAIEAGLSADQLGEWLAGGQDEVVALLLPRFRLALNVELKRALQALGMTDAFVQGRADFSGAARACQLFVSSVVQKSCVEANEEGTEAAAVSAARVVGRVPVFRADHPFLFLIRHKASGLILFMGRVANPAT